MVVKHRLRIKEIADLKEQKVWKIQWMGGLSINPLTGEMLFEVLLVPFRKNLFGNGKNSRRFVDNSHFVHNERKLVKLGVGQLQLARIGAIYIDGYPIEHPEFITKKFSFRVTQDNQKIISLGDSWEVWSETQEKERTSYYIPAAQYEVLYNSNKREAYPFKCTVVTFSEDEIHNVSLNESPLHFISWKKERNKLIKPVTGSTKVNNIRKVSGLIIPCMELIRFYYTKSSQSCQKILFGGPDKLFEREHTIKPENEKNGFLMLSRYARNKDAPIIARYAFDDYAFTEANNISRSAIKNKNLEGKALPEARFPFHDQSTELTVHGTYVQSGDRIYFLVFYISSCSASFPYEELEFWRLPSGNMQGKETNQNIFQQRRDELSNDENYFDEDRKRESERIKSAKNADETEMQSEEIPADIKEKLNILLNEKERFPFLKNCIIEPRKPKSIGNSITIEKEKKLKFEGDFSENIEVGGTAPPGGNRLIRKVSVTPETLDPDPPDIEDVSSQYYYEKEVDLPELEDLFEDSEDEIIDKKEIFDENLPVSNDSTESENTKLSVDLKVFRSILGWTQKSYPQLKIRMLKIPPTGDAIFTVEGTMFPSHIKERQSVPKTKTNQKLYPTLYIAEIKNENSGYAYLMDIKAIHRKSGIDKGFQMFLCFEERSHKKLGVDTLRHILDLCLTNGGKWLESNTADKLLSKKDVFEEFEGLSRAKYKHDCFSSERYAERILNTLKTEGWLS